MKCVNYSRTHFNTRHEAEQFFYPKRPTGWRVLIWQCNCGKWVGRFKKRKKTANDRVKQRAFKARKQMEKETNV